MNNPLSARFVTAIALGFAIGVVCCAEGQEPQTAEPSAQTAQPTATEDDPLVRDINERLRGRNAAGAADEQGLALGNAQTEPLINLGRWVLSVMFVIALILILYALVKRFGSRTPFLAGAGLGQVIGRIYLSRQAALYFVETGGRVLVVGVTGNNISLVSEFDADAFDEGWNDEEEEGPMDSETFLSQLEQSSQAMQTDSPRNRAAASVPMDRDMASMKSELERMRRMLADEEEESVR